MIKEWKAKNMKEQKIKKKKRKKEKIRQKEKELQMNENKSITKIFLSNTEWRKKRIMRIFL